MPHRFWDGQVTILGGRFPKAVVFLAGLLLTASVAGAVTWRAGIPFILAGGVLNPSLVFGGEVWRLVTWSFLETQALSLVFALLILLFLGRDLCYAWGAGTFVSAWIGFAAGSATLTCLVGRFLWSTPLVTTYAGAWPVLEAFIIAWAVLHPGRQILVYFVLPVGGRNLIYLTIAGTVLFALLDGVVFYVPHFMAQGLALAWAYGYSPRSLWLRLKARTVRFTPARRPPHLRAVDRDDEPPRWLH